MLSRFRRGTARGSGGETDFFEQKCGCRLSNRRHSETADFRALWRGGLWVVHSGGTEKPGVCDRATRRACGDVRGRTPRRRSGGGRGGRGGAAGPVPGAEPGRGECGRSLGRLHRHQGYLQSRGERPQVGRPDPTLPRPHPRPAPTLPMGRWEFSQREGSPPSWAPQSAKLRGRKLIILFFFFGGKLKYGKGVACARSRATQGSPRL